MHKNLLPDLESLYQSTVASTKSYTPNRKIETFRETTSDRNSSAHGTPANTMRSAAPGSYSSGMLTRMSPFTRFLARSPKSSTWVLIKPATPKSAQSSSYVLPTKRSRTGPTNALACGIHPRHSYACEILHPIACTRRPLFFFHQRSRAIAT